MAVEFKTVEAIDALVALLRVADDSAVHCWEQDEPFHPGIFPGLILLARFASQRAGDEYMKAVAAAEQIRKLEAERNAARELHLVAVRRDDKEVERRLDVQEQLAQVTAERDSARQWAETLRRECEEEKDRLQKDHSTEANEMIRMQDERMAERDNAIRSANEWEALAKQREQFLLATQGMRDEALAERDAARKQRDQLRERLAEIDRAVSEAMRAPTNAEPTPAPAPEPYQWQVGDEIECPGVTRRRVTDRSEGWV